MFKKKRKRYLPHDPNMILEKTIVEDNDTVIEQPVTVEALNLQSLWKKAVEVTPDFILCPAN